ncbi:hypothetical protein [Sphingomonas abietis]|uniref:Restriction endonuclease type IV Mrr domain-containing protein n=1 Tax=Sphingomonas abietis TaxID=3012344 RepID=A0ABY7NHB1_9SPHN|nr:hypothetical protein [Sphingomonas abietis]WBO20922.1 hypothetical protein PBT88_11945 [Sphingomonas abietis]
MTMDAGDSLDTTPDADARRLAIEAIASLVYIKKTAAEQVLRRAEVPEDLIRRFLTERDPATGDKRSKRDAGAVVLDALAQTGQDHAVVRNIVSLAADWTAFHLAQNEYQARAVVQKARELRGVLAAADERERSEAEARRTAAAQQRSREQADMMRRQSALLLAQFDQAASSDDHQKRGYLLEDLLNRTFDLHGIAVVRPFRRNGGAEQIDAAFELDGWHYLVECRWRTRLPDIRQLDGLAGQVARSGRQTMGLFLSVEGWSEHVVPLLKQSPDKAIFLMEGFDLRSVLDQLVDLRRLLKAKISALNLEAEPYMSVARLLA